MMPAQHPELPYALDRLAIYLYTRYRELGEIEDLDAAIVLIRNALGLYPHGHPRQHTSLNHLAVQLGTRYEYSGKLEDLDEAILLERNALALCPPGHQDRWLHSNNLASDLSTRHERLSGMEDLNEAISLDRDTLALAPSGHQERSRFLNSLASHLSIRYRRLGKQADIEEAIILAQEALALCPPGHSNRPVCLNNLATYLCTRYTQRGGIENINEAIVFNREALALCQRDHLHKFMSLSNLSSNLLTRYEQLGGEEDLNEAILLSRDAVTFCPPGHPNRWMILGNLASHLYTRYIQLWGLQDLDEAILLDRDVLVLCPQRHIDRSYALNNLASHLFVRYEQLGEEANLEESNFLAREALELLPLDHPRRSASLNNLAMYLSSRYHALGKLEDLDEAIVLNRDALALCPLGHPHRATALNNVAIHLLTRCKQLGRVADLEEAIVLSRDALALYIPGHPGRTLTLNNVAALLYIRYKLFGEAEDRDEMFSLYAQLQHVSQSVSLHGLSAARAWVDATEDLRHPTTLLAYEAALRLLVQHLAILPALPQHRIVLRVLSSSLAVDAFSACLRNKSPINAVELLEQGRGTFWNQLSRLRSPLDDVISSGPTGKALADEFTRLTFRIRNALELPDVNQHDRVCHLNTELQRVVSSIRRLPGLSYFLCPLPYTKLQRAADGGPVIIVNASKYGCDALVISVDYEPVHIPLSITKESVQKLSSSLRTLTVRAKRLDVTRDLGLFLRQLWDEVVSPIVDFLRTAHPPQSRIWWCPTADFTHLPLHAAGPYRKGEKNFADLYISSYTPTLSALIRARQSYSSNVGNEQKLFLGIGQAKADGENELLSVSTELADIGQLVDGLATFTPIEGPESCVSRVTKELGMHQWVHFACHGLPNFRRPSYSSNVGNEQKLFLGIGQAKADGENELLSVSTELADIGQLVDGLATFTPIEGPESCVSRVTKELGMHQWVHFACHGLPNKNNPFESAFALHDEHFTVQHIIRCDIKDPEFAYLSACHTTVGDAESVDEAIHLASAMQFAGFRSVIGTMWSVDDAETNKITSMFYKYMVDPSSRLDHTRGAFALWKTMRSVKVPLDQRILYVHLGV